MSKFPVPVSGEKIPHGWFANLVRFVNSLTLRGDGRYTMVSRNESGTTVTLTPAVKNAIENSGGTPPGSGGGTAVIGIPDYSTGILMDNPTSPHQASGGTIWIGGTARINYLGSGSGGSVQFIVSAGQYSSDLFTPVIIGYNEPNMEADAAFLYPVSQGLYYRFSLLGSATIAPYIFQPL